MIYQSIAIKYYNDPNLMDFLLTIAKIKGQEVIGLKKEKLAKLEKVGIEAKCVILSSSSYYPLFFNIFTSV